MNQFRNLWRSVDGPSDSTNTTMTSNESTAAASDRSSGGTLNRLIGNRRSQTQPQSRFQSHQNDSPSHSSRPDWRGVLRYSQHSTQGPFQARAFISENFMLGAGAVIIQPSSGKVVIVQDGDSWFLPKGRKDLGESIEQAALREAYEEVSVSLLSYPDLSRSHSDPPSPVWLPMRVLTALPLDERSDRRFTSGLWTKTRRTTIRHHRFLHWTA